MQRGRAWAVMVLTLWLVAVVRGQETVIAPSFLGELEILPFSGLHVYLTPKSSPKTSLWGLPEFRVLAQWGVPLSATNSEGFIRFNAFRILRMRNDVFVFGGELPPGTNVVRVPLEFLATYPSNFASTNFQIDVSPWVRQFAGGKMGLEIIPVQDTEEDDYDSVFESFSLTLVEPQSYDAPPHVRWSSEPPRKSATQGVNFFAKVADVDTRIDRVQVLAENQIVAERTDVGDVVGTNVVVIAAQNFPFGEHTVKLRAFSNGKSADSEERRIFVYDPATTPKHYYVDLQESAGSFYVVDAAGRAYAWGSNDWSQLGIGDPYRVGFQVRHPAKLAQPDGLAFRQISAGTDFAVGLMEDGSLYVWGNVTNHFQWGLGGARGEGFVKVPFPDDVVFFTRVVANDSGFYALDQRGKAWATIGPHTFAFAAFNGFSDINRVGDDLALGHTVTWIVNAPFEAFPYGDPLYYPPGPARYPVGVSKWISAATSSRSTPGTVAYHNLAVGDDLQLYAWGTNTLGELPIASLATAIPTRVTVRDVSGWKTVATSERYSLALAEDGRIFGWGPGFASNEPNPSQPKEISFPKAITNWVEIAVTDRFALAVSGDGEVYSWGQGARGAWHDPDADVALFPEKVEGLPNVASPSAGAAATAQFNLSTFFNGQLMFWGLAPNGVEVPIQVSSDLKTWVDFESVGSINGVFSFTPAMEGSVKFYRVRP